MQYTHLTYIFPGRLWSVHGTLSPVKRCLWIAEVRDPQTDTTSAISATTWERVCQCRILIIHVEEICHSISKSFPTVWIRELFGTWRATVENFVGYPELSDPERSPILRDEIANKGILFLYSSICAFASSPQSPSLEARPFSFSTSDSFFWGFFNVIVMPT